VVNRTETFPSISIPWSPSLAQITLTEGVEGDGWYSKYYLHFQKSKLPNDANCTETSPSVSVPCAGLRSPSVETDEGIIWAVWNGLRMECFNKHKHNHPSLHAPTSKLLAFPCPNAECHHAKRHYAVCSGA
jgi:hypothetical protein